MPSQAASQAKATVAANLDRAIRESKRFDTNRAVGETIGATEHQVWRWRKGIHTPSLDYLAALADLFFDGDLGRFYDDPERSAA